MRIAVLGGGTAGYIAAAHLTKRLPESELLHVFDSRIPTIGVGEGTTPRFLPWFEETTGLPFAHLAERCGATLKTGTRFEGWGDGSSGSEFLHRFQPIRLIGCHFDAAAVVEVLAEHVRARRIDARVEEVHSTTDGVQLMLEGGVSHACDYVLDARGFPRTPSGSIPDNVVTLNWIPTSRATIRRLAPGAFSGVTRAVARPHGWIFQIPLREWTSCGYIFNGTISADAEVEADFTEFLAEEGVSEWSPRGMLNFPNFLHRKMFDGRTFRLGNAAGFLEPLEATAIGSAIVQTRYAAHWMEAHGPQSSAAPDDVETLNEAITTYVMRDSLFLAWHYACGSRWDTPFWRYARQGLERAQQSIFARGHLAAMKEYVSAGRALPGRALATYDNQDQWDREVYPLLKIYRPFGNFSELNFAQVGHGIGAYSAPRRGTPRRQRTGV